MVKRRVIRGNVDAPGYATRVATFFERVLIAVNSVHTLQQYPLTIEHVLERMADGKQIVEKMKVAKETEVLDRRQSRSWPKQAGESRAACWAFYQASMMRDSYQRSGPLN
jgi:hypothetical protein